MSAVPAHNIPLHLPHFTLIKKCGESCLYKDKELGIVKIQWVEAVTEEMAKEVIKGLVQLLQSGDFSKVMMIKDEHTVFAQEATTWMRSFLLTNRGLFSFKVSRIAGVTPDVFRANIFANFIKTALQVIFPGVKISNFEFEESAIDWLV